MYYGCTCRGTIRNEIYMLSGQSEEAKVWDFKGKAGNLQVNEKKQMHGKQILAVPPGSSGTEGEA